MSAPLKSLHVSEDQAERLFLDILEVESKYQGRWNVSKIVGYCWMLCREKMWQIQPLKSRQYQYKADCFVKIILYLKLNLNFLEINMFHVEYIRIIHFEIHFTKNLCLIEKSCGHTYWWMTSYHLFGHYMASNFQ